MNDQIAPLIGVLAAIVCACLLVWWMEPKPPAVKRRALESDERCKQLRLEGVQSREMQDARVAEYCRIKGVDPDVDSCARDWYRSVVYDGSGCADADTQVAMDQRRRLKR